MANIQQVRYDLPSAPTPGFMDYAAQFLTNYMAGKQSQKEQKSKELMTLLPALAAKGQVQPGGPIQFGGVPGGFGITPGQEATPLPGYEGVPGVTDWGKAGQYLRAKDLESWAQGKPTPKAIWNEAFNNIFIQTQDPIAAQQGAMKVVEEMMRGETTSGAKEQWLNQWKTLTPAQKKQAKKNKQIIEEAKGLGIDIWAL